jgi:hypothetical protein
MIADEQMAIVRQTLHTGGGQVTTIQRTSSLPVRSDSSTIDLVSCDE